MLTLPLRLLEMQLKAVLDLRDPAVGGALGPARRGTVAPAVQVARATATFIHRTTLAEGLLVPSMAC